MIKSSFLLGFHPFHMVSYSPWPLLGSLAILSLAMNSLFYVWKVQSLLVVLSSVLTLSMVCFQWWRDVIRESTFQGCHTVKVCKGLYLGVVMFILSEVMFFFSFFFGFFFISLNPDIEVGNVWPPSGVQPLSFLEVPLLNTLLLLSSGVSITWVHHSLLESNKSQTLLGGLITILLGLVFTYFQYLEYDESSFTMADSCYGSFFFLMTGFHGIHVMVGALFISIMIIRVGLNHFSNNHHIGFEAAAWYWHFVDVVWLFLYVVLYWWGS